MAQCSQKNVIANLSVCVANVCVCTSIELRRLSSYHWHFFQCFLQKMVGWVALEVSLRFMLKFKPFEM